MVGQYIVLGLMFAVAIGLIGLNAKVKYTKEQIEKYKDIPPPGLL